MTIIFMLLLLPLQSALGTGRLICVSDQHVGYTCHDNEPASDRIADELHEPAVVSDTECGNCVDMPIGDSPIMKSSAAVQGFELQWAVAQFWFGVFDPPRVSIPLRYGGRGEASPFSARAFALTISPRC